MKPLYAFITTEPAGNEGILTEVIKDNWVPFVFSDEKLIPLLKERTIQIHKLSGRPVRLVKFSSREVLWEKG